MPKVASPHWRETGTPSALRAMTRQPSARWSTVSEWLIHTCLLYTSGKSITDQCISWDTTVEVLENLAAAVRKRRAKRQEA